MADLYYIEEGYYDAGYYVYTAVAASTINSAFSQSCDAEKITSGVTVNATGSFNSEGTSSFQATKIANGVADFTASFTQSATISHIHGSDLFAFTEAAIAVQVDRIRGNNIAASEVFNIATSVERIQQGDADADAIFSAIINGLRSRDVNLDAQAAFSFDSTGDRIRFGESVITAETTVSCDATEITPFIQGEAIFASEFAIQADCEKILQYSSTVNLTATLTAAISHIEGADLTAFSDAALTAQAERTRDTQANISDAFSTQATATRIQQAQADISSQAAVSSVASASKEFNVSIQSAVEVGATISHIEGADLFAFSQSTLSASAERTRDTQANISDAFSTQATATRIQSLEAAVISSSDVSTTVIRNRFSSADLQSQSDVAVSADKIKNAQADFTSQSTVGALVGNIKQYASSQTSQVSVDTIVYKITESASSATSTTTVVAFSSVARGSTIIAFNFASLNVLPFVSVTVSSNLVSQASSQATINKIADGTASLSSELNVSGAGERLRDNQSSCSSVSSLSIDNARIRYSQPSLASVATLTAVIGKQQSIDLYAFSNNSLIADVAVVRSALADSQSQFTTNIAIGKIPPIDAALSAVVSLTAANTRLKFANASLVANGGVVSLVDVIPGVRIVMGSAFITNKAYAEDGYVEDEYATNFLTIANYIVDNLQQLSAAFTLTANAQSAVQGAALLANSGTMTTTAVKITVASSSQLSNANTNIDVAKTVNIALSVQSAFTVFANGGRQDEVFLTAFTNAALVATARKVVSPSSNNNAVFTLFADTADSLSIRGQANLSAAFSSSAAIRKITGFGAVLQASGFTVTVGTASKVQGASLSSAFSVSATTSVIRNGVANTAVVSSASIQITRARTTSAAIASAMAFAVEIREIRLDEIVYVIPGENWTYTITSETRIHDVYGETRIRSITGESRIRTITGESRIHTT